MVAAAGDVDCELSAGGTEGFPRKDFEFVVGCARDGPFSEDSVAVGNPGRAVTKPYKMALRLVWT
jgi:hypothetical protein